MTTAEIDEIVAAYLIGDIGEALRLVALEARPRPSRARGLLGPRCGEAHRA